MVNMLDHFTLITVEEHLALLAMIIHFIEDNTQCNRMSQKQGANKNESSYEQTIYPAQVLHIILHILLLQELVARAN